MYNGTCNFPSPRDRLKGKMRYSICCFCSPTPYMEGTAAVEPLEEVKSRTPRSPYIKEKCKSLFTRIGKGVRKHYSSDFSYDPMSYALNFEDESSRDDEFPIISFTSRLPATPERSPALKSFEATPLSVTRELYAYS